MRLTGTRSNTNRLWGRWLTAALLLVFVGARPARALDGFTLWRQPEIPLRMVEGSWVEYRTQAMAGGKREERLSRIVCLDREHGSDAGTWLVEIVPLVEQDGETRPQAGEGLQLRISRDLLRRQGTFFDAIVEAVQWRSGRAEKISAADLRQDPLVQATLDGDFVPDTVEQKGSTTRIVGGRQLLCDQIVMSARDTLVADLPAGKMIQVTTREIAAAIHPEVPFLGLAYVSERVRSASELDPPSRRFRPPPPHVRVEVMELVGFGTQATPVLGITD